MFGKTLLLARASGTTLLINLAGQKHIGFMQDVMYYLQEYMQNGDLFHALADDEHAAELSWYKR